MLQRPQMAFDNAELKSCTIKLDGHNQPLGFSGAFATVYKGTIPSGRSMAIRVFTKRSDERRERYAEISKYLNARRLNCLVNFAYIEKGIRHPSGQWYPLVTMDWVEGDVLFDWLRHQCGQQATGALGNVAEQWVELVSELSNAGIAHGDLQHANVMVNSAGQLKLVDYDCMCVPALVGHVNLELGVEPYQHPDRDEHTKLFPGLDHFSALFIHVALRALAAEPILWQKFVESTQYDKMLFRKSDFDNPDQSELYKDLKRSPDPKVRKLVDDLVAAANEAATNP